LSHNLHFHSAAGFGICLLLAGTALAGGPSAGDVHDETVPSQILDSSRHVHIYLPVSYSAKPDQRFPVLYVHDGQNVFSTAGTNVAFGWGNWELDLTADHLIREKKMRPIIIVAIDNLSARRMTEYSGHHGAENQTSDYDRYSAFLIQELKPYMDRNYRTLPGPAQTGVMGSSLGGLCSAALAWEHPDVIRNAASLSGAFFYDEKHFLESLKNYKGPSKPVKFYFDSGVVDFMGGDDGRTMTAAVAVELRRINGPESLLLYVDEHPMTPGQLEKAGLRKDKWKEAQTSQHNEFYWRMRAWRALTFMFPPGK
jgi:predicted alpha/beta superfamily hydrolase